jgi:hypothetical protein
MKLRVIDLDGGVVGQGALWEHHRADVVPMTDWGPAIRICCSFGAYRRFEAALAERGGAAEGPAITFCGSGDFHHVTLALLRQVPEPFHLLVLDKHPDWMRGAPLLHCGTWVAHALELPRLRGILHLGAALDLENWLYRFAPWGHLIEGRVRLVPAVHRLTRGRWRSVSREPLRAAADRPMTADRLEDLCGTLRDGLDGLPLYVSIDKDVLRSSDAAVNWDSGHLELDEVQRLLTGLIAAAQGRLIGMDVVGDWSCPRLRGVMRKVLNRTEHPRLEVDPEAAAALNGRTNRALIETVLRAVRGAS